MQGSQSASTSAANSERSATNVSTDSNNATSSTNVTDFFKKLLEKDKKAVAQKELEQKTE